MLWILYEMGAAFRTVHWCFHPDLNVLELAFATTTLRSACEDPAVAHAEYGPSVADALVARLADLRAASHPLEVPFVKVHPATDAADAQLSVALADGRSLVMLVNHEKPPASADGIRWELVSRLLLVRVE